MTAQIIGWIGTALTSICFLPQLIKVIKTRNTDDLSFYMLCIVIVASIFWIAFGIMTNSIQVLVTNVLQVTITTTIWIWKITNMVKKSKTKKPKKGSK